MAIDKKLFGKRAMTTSIQTYLKPGSIVDIIGPGASSDTYTCKIVDAFWQYDKDMAHNCDGQFSEDVGYYIQDFKLEVMDIEENEDKETITYDLDNPFGGMEKFK